MHLKQIIKRISFLMIAVVGGGAVTLLDIPVGWLIGSLIATIIMGALGIQAPPTKSTMPYVKSSIGALIGASVTLSFFHLLLGAWASIVFLLSSIGLTIGLGYLLLNRVFKLDRSTSMLCSIPGGMTEMSILSDRVKCDQVQVAIAHLVRVTLAVLTLPFIISIFSGIEFTSSDSTYNVIMQPTDWMLLLGCIVCGGYSEKRFNLQAGVIIIPFFLCAGLNLSGIATLDVPPSILAFAQIAIGINIGAKFRLIQRSTLKKAMNAGLAIVLLQIVVSVIISFIAAATLDGDTATYLISYAPGGLAEMSIIAVAMQLEAAFVALNHLVRLTVSLMIAPVLLRWVK